MEVTATTAADLLHLVYIHGFKGDESNFQGFPNDMHEHFVKTKIPEGSPLVVKSTIYPRYKTEKPLLFAVKNFIEWLSLQPPGLVVLLGHSMGGLLAAEAAFYLDLHPSTNHQVIGIVALDTPFLGLHPHVAKSSLTKLVFGSGGKKKKQRPPRQEDGSRGMEGENGDGDGDSDSDSDGDSLIPSLSPCAKSRPNAKTSQREIEKKMNPSVDVVDEKVSDDWESVKGQVEAESGGTIDAQPSPTNPSPPSSRPASPSKSFRGRFLAVSESLARMLQVPFTPSPRSRSRSLAPSPAPPPPPPAELNNEPSDGGADAGFQVFIESLQFSSAVLDFIGLKSRYERLTKWKGGRWVAYWTESHVVYPNANSGGDAGASAGATTRRQITAAGAEAATPTSTSTPGPGFKIYKFLLLPTSTGLGGWLSGSVADKWEKVVVANVKSEIHGHVLMFKRKNLVDYDAFLERVSQRIMGWVEEEKGGTAC